MKQRRRCRFEEEQRRRLKEMGVAPLLRFESHDLALPIELTQGFFGGREPLLGRFVLDGSRVFWAQFFDDCGREIPVVGEVVYRLTKYRKGFAVLMVSAGASWSDAVPFPLRAEGAPASDV